MLLLGCEVGSATVSPSSGTAGQLGTWTVRYRVGPEGIGPGGGVRVQLPDAWHVGEAHQLRLLQSDEPGAEDFVVASTSRLSVAVDTTVEVNTEQEDFRKRRRLSLDGRSERYVQVVRAEVTSGQLEAGDSIHVVFGATSGGSPGMRAARISTPPQEVLMEVRSTPLGPYRRVTGELMLQSLSDRPAEVQVFLPSSSAVGEAGELHLSIVDAHANPHDASGSPVSFDLEVLTGDLEIPRSVRIAAATGSTSIPFVSLGPGIARVLARQQDGVLEARSNPMQIEVIPPERRVLWGDLHSHTELSYDGVGSEAFTYARDVSGLDFFARTDHSLSPDGDALRGLGPHIWPDYIAEADRHNAPGRFVTLHAYELSFGPPWGHHNIYFRGDPGPLLNEDEIGLPDLTDLLEAGGALAVPHHTGKFPDIDWLDHDPALRRNIELYSGHGLSEAYDPAHPLSFESVAFSGPGESSERPQFVQDAWNQGLELSTLAASDDHLGQPGKPQLGLTAVLAEDTTRAAVFDALHERRTYATTGARILLDFSVGGARMGSRVLLQEAPVVSVEVHGTDTISWIEVLRSNRDGAGFEVIRRNEPRRLSVSWKFRDTEWAPGSVYYVRVRQSADIRGRAVMAWSSPVWVITP